MTLNVVERSDLEKMKAEILSKMEEIKDTLQKNKPQKDWLTEKEACKMLDVSKSTIQNYRRNGKLAFTQYKNKIMYKYEDLNNFLLQNYINNGQ